MFCTMAGDRDDGRSVRLLNVAHVATTLCFQVHRLKTAPDYDGKVMIAEA